MIGNPYQNNKNFRNDFESSDECENASGYSFFDDALVMEMFNSARGNTPDGGENVPLESFEGSHHPDRLTEPRSTVGDVILVTGTPAKHHHASGGEENVSSESFEGSHHPDCLPEPRKTVGDVVLTTENRSSHDRISGGGENFLSEPFEGSHPPDRSPEPRKTVGDLVLATETSESHHRNSGREENGDGGENVPAHDSLELYKKRKYAEPSMRLSNIRKFQRAPGKSYVNNRGVTGPVKEILED